MPRKSILDTLPDDDAPAKQKQKTDPVGDLLATIGNSPASLNEHFRPLGYAGDRYFFFSHAKKQVVELTAGKLARPAEILQLAPLEWWIGAFWVPSLSGMEILKIANCLIDACHRAGVFQPSIRRGRGVWIDSGRLVIHLGDRLVIDGKDYPLTHHDTQCVYEARGQVHLNGDEPLTLAEAAEVLTFFRSLNWAKSLYGDLMAGWLVVSILSGALRWRPHVLLIGARGSGKTWILDICQQMLGEFMLAMTGSTTEPGIRSSLQLDALPIFLDESEAKSLKSAARLDDILELMRATSADSSATIRKGSQGGGSIEYLIRSCFALGAIRNPITSAADHSRITVLQMAHPTNASRTYWQQETKLQAGKITSPEYVRRFRSRVFTNAKNILDSIEVFRTLAGDHFGDQRTGDQIGTLLGGAWGLVRNRLPEDHEVREMLTSRDWTDQQEILEDSSDEQDCMRHILTTSVPVETATWRGTATVHELVEYLMSLGRRHPGDTSDPGFSKLPVYEDEAKRALERIGLRVMAADRQLLIQNQHPELTKIMSKTPFPTNWGALLLRIDGSAKTVNPVRVLGNQSRGVLVPL